MNDRTPILIEWSDANVDGCEGKRLVVVLNAPGCEYARNGQGCTNCSFPGQMAAHHEVSSEDLLIQLEAALETIPPNLACPIEIDLYNSGSFFNPNEIQGDAATAILARVATVERVRRVLVESRPEYIAVEKVRRAAAILQGKTLEVGIGLESANEEIREHRIRKGFSFEDFERAAWAIAEAGASLLVYVLLKPLGTEEKEAIDDAVATIRAVFDLGKRLDVKVRAALQPCFVGPRTALEEAYKQRRYRPPRLWSVVQVVLDTAESGPVTVGLSDEALLPEEAAHNCDACSKTVREALARFNRTRDARPLKELRCDCRSLWSQIVST